MERGPDPHQIRRPANNNRNLINPSPQPTFIRDAKTDYINFKDTSISEDDDFKTVVGLEERDKLTELGSEASGFTVPSIVKGIGRGRGRGGGRTDEKNGAVKKETWSDVASDDSGYTVQSTFRVSILGFIGYT